VVIDVFWFCFSSLPIAWTQAAWWSLPSRALWIVYFFPKFQYGVFSIWSNLSVGQTNLLGTQIRKWKMIFLHFKRTEKNRNSSPPIVSPMIKSKTQFSNDTR